MTRADALRLAGALERALPDLPDRRALTQKTIPRSAGGTEEPWGLDARHGATISPLEEFSGENKATLGHFIAHCISFSTRRAPP